MMTRVLFGLLALLALGMALPRAVTAWFARPRLHTVEGAPRVPVAIVFGAGLRRDGTPTPVLRDRVATAADLFFAGKVDRLLMSGDNRFEDYNEPGAMRDYALSLGVPAEAIVLDYAGRRTYDTCYRARDIFAVPAAILVTQGFHIPRALYTCHALGLPAVGVPVDRRSYRRGPALFWNFREVFATVVAFWELHVTHPVPVLGPPEPIFSLEGV